MNSITSPAGTGSIAYQSVNTSTRDAACLAHETIWTVNDRKPPGAVRRPLDRHRRSWFRNPVLILGIPAVVALRSWHCGRRQYSDPSRPFVRIQPSWRYVPASNLRTFCRTSSADYSINPGQLSANTRCRRWSEKKSHYFVSCFFSQENLISTLVVNILASKWQDW